MTRYLLVFVIALGGMVGDAPAQTLNDLTGSAGAFYTFADPTDIKIEIKVWGAVSNPGLYEVRQGLNLSTLLSLAGGPQATVRDTRSHATFTIRLMRPQPDGQHAVIAETVMDNEILLLEQDPVLLNGDILIAEEHVRQRFGWRDGVSIITGLATLALLVERLINVTK